MCISFIRLGNLKNPCASLSARPASIWVNKAKFFKNHLVALNYCISHWLLSTSCTLTSSVSSIFSIGSLQTPHQTLLAYHPLSHFSHAQMQTLNHRARSFSTPLDTDFEKSLDSLLPPSDMLFLCALLWFTGPLPDSVLAVFCESASLNWFFPQK